MVGSTVGPYRVVRLIGTGGMGEVFLAEDTRLHRRVALKRLSGAQLADSDALRRLLHEARAAARLNHPAIAAVHDILDNGPYPLIVMEHVEGESLAERLQRGPLDERAAVEIGVQLTGALAHAHAHGVVHRDLKPANVHLTPDGHIKVLDFGLAAVSAGTDALTVSRSAESLLIEGQIAGTLPYMAPEQLRGMPGTPASDIYSLGVMLFEMLAGRRPFETADVAGIGLAVFDATPRVQRCAPAVSAALDAVVARAMAREPAARFPSAAALQQALEQTRRAAGPARRAHSLRRAAIAAAVLATIGSVGWWGWRQGWGRQQDVGEARAGTARAALPRVVAFAPFAVTGFPKDRGEQVAGVVDVIAAGLGRVPGLTVLPPSAALDLTPAEETPQGIARALGAGYTVSGTVNATTGGFRADVRLERVGRATPIWRAELSAPTLRSLQEQVSDGLVAALERAGALEGGTGPLTLRAPASADREAYEQFLQARGLLDREDVPSNIARAVLLLESAVGRDRRFAHAHAALAQAYWLRYAQTRDQAWTVKARDAALQATVLAPDDPDVNFAVAVIYRGTGRNDTAVDLLRTVIANQPAHDRAHGLLGEILAEQGQADEGTRQLNRAIALRPSWWGHHAALGYAAFAANRYDEAVAAFTRVIELQPDNAWGYQMAGTAYHASGNRELARARYERAVSISPTARTYSNLGTLAYEEGRFADAVKAYEASLKLQPKSAVTFNNLGDARREQGNAAGARSSYSRAVELALEGVAVNPNDAERLSLLALYEAKAGRIEEASRHAADSLRLQSTSSEVLYNRAVVLSYAGRVSEAVDSLEAALEHGYSRERARHDRDLAGLRTDERFRRAVADHTSQKERAR